MSVILGWTYVPSTYPEENSIWRGSVAYYATFPPSPGYSAIEFYNQGMTVVHESGHYFNLLHPFSSGCNYPSDWVVDTPYEAVPYYGDCSIPRDSCASLPGNDLLPDFMDYTDDSCMDRFTPGQVERMQQSVVMYLPSLLSMEPIQVCTTGGNHGTAPANLICANSHCLQTVAPNGMTFTGGWCMARGSAFMWGDCMCDYVNADRGRSTSQPSTTSGVVIQDGSSSPSASTTSSPTAKRKRKNKGGHGRKVTPAPLYHLESLAPTVPARTPTRETSAPVRTGSTAAPTSTGVVAVLNPSTCHVRVTYSQAVVACANASLHLCTKTEVLSGAVKRALSTNSVCSDLANATVWTQNVCRAGVTAVSAKATRPYEAECHSQADTYVAPCCSNNS
jgi:hypothetical protein